MALARFSVEYQAGLPGVYVYRCGVYLLAVTVTADDGRTATSYSTATVALQPLTVAPPPSPLANPIANVTVATFTLQNPNANVPSASFSAAIAWGDGDTTTSSGAIKPGQRRLQHRRQPHLHPGRRLHA